MWRKVLANIVKLVLIESVVKLVLIESVVRVSSNGPSVIHLYKKKDIVSEGQGARQHESLAGNMSECLGSSTRVRAKQRKCATGADGRHWRDRVAMLRNLPRGAIACNYRKLALRLMRAALT